MITRNQFRFLKEFIKEAKTSKEKDEQLKFFNREKIDIDTFEKLLIKHPELNPSEPLNQKGDDEISGVQLIEYINDVYLKQIGMFEMIEYYSPNKYGISQEGLKAISEYKIEILSKVKLPIIDVALSIISIIISIIAICVAA